MFAEEESKSSPKRFDDWSSYPTNQEIPSNSNVSSALTNNVFIDKSPPSLQSQKSSKLFGESDSDSDDIFSKKTTSKRKIVPENEKIEQSQSSSSIVSTTKSIINKIPVDSSSNSTVKASTSKIFSDESSDDDLFGSSKKLISNQSKDSAQTKTTFASKEIKGDKLFSDTDEDDDDLFGSKSKRMFVSLKQNLQINKKNFVFSSEKPLNTASKKSSSTSIPKEPTTGTVSNNPLADLLK